jgi:formate dehydrogenase subunit delta
MNIERLVQMANDIAGYFSSEPEHREAVAGVVNHLQKFWDPAMRKQIIAQAQAGGEGLSDLAQAAVEQLAGATNIT